MNRLPGNLRRVPHIDLLPLARRLWRNRFGSVAMSNLEKGLLAVQRNEADVPGWLIPTIYNDYLRSNDARELRRVFYHNEIDMLSMVTLADYLVRLISEPPLDAHPIDLYSLGKWQADIGLATDAEKTLKDAVYSDLPLPVFHQALARLGLLLKRQQRSEEAVIFWRQWAATSFDEVDAHVELAKFYEWEDKDLKSAERWTLEALSLVDTWSDARSEIVRHELTHRLLRIQRKLSL
jgi:tetratricopeptide (TPR) repeat protein